MGFLQKKVNIFLLLIIVIMVIALGVSAVYYNETFMKQGSECAATSSMLDTCESSLQSYKDLLNRTVSELNQTTEDIHKYDVLYENKSVELESTKKDLEDTSEELETTKDDLAEYIDRYTLEKKRADGLQEDFDAMKALRDILAQHVEDLENQVVDLQAELDECSEP